MFENHCSPCYFLLVISQLSLFDFPLVTSSIGLNFPLITSSIGLDFPLVISYIGLDFPLVTSSVGLDFPLVTSSIGLDFPLVTSSVGLDFQLVTSSIGLDFQSVYKLSISLDFHFVTNHLGHPNFYTIYNSSLSSWYFILLQAYLVLLISLYHSWEPAWSLWFLHIHSSFWFLDFSCWYGQHYFCLISRR